MTQGGKKFPPKKKHVTRPRLPAVVPLTDAERVALAHQEFAKSKVHIEEAETLAKLGAAPNACTHAAYYAMYHCAAAAILAAGGVGKRRDFPASHTHVLAHFGTLVEGEPGYLGQTGRLLGRAQISRATADYGLADGVSVKDARERTVEARQFIDSCAAKWQLT